MNLDREKASGVIYVKAGNFDSFLDWIDPVLDGLEGCVVPDPRLARIAALCDDPGYAGLPSNLVAQIRAILGGGPA